MLCVVTHSYTTLQPATPAKSDDGQLKQQLGDAQAQIQANAAEISKLQKDLATAGTAAAQARHWSDIVMITKRRSPSCSPSLLLPRRRLRKARRLLASWLRPRSSWTHCSSPSTPSLCATRNHAQSAHFLQADATPEVVVVGNDVQFGRDSLWQSVTSPVASPANPFAPPATAEYVHVRRVHHIQTCFAASPSKARPSR